VYSSAAAALQVRPQKSAPKSPPQEFRSPQAAETVTRLRPAVFEA
jgi:hypothetical protein